MRKITTFDVAIVYSENTANSARSDSSITLPFPLNSNNATLNYVYGYFLDVCARLGMTAAFTTSKDIIAAGSFASYWLFKNGDWIKAKKPCKSNQIFDKFSPTNSKIRLSRQLLFSSPKVKQFNNPHLFTTFFDKQLTYNALSPYAIPTVSLVGTTLTSVIKSCNKLEKLRNSSLGTLDFTDDIIMKDRFGAGGWQVYKFGQGQESAMLQVQKENPQVSFILQPFVDFDAKDIRLIYLDGVLKQSYFRTAKEGDFRCNEHQGGTSTYLDLSDIPRKVMAMATDITATIHAEDTLFALDFITGKSGQVYFLEGNTGPGLSWNKTIKYETYMAQKLIRQIVQSLKSRLISPQPSLHIHRAKSPFAPLAKETLYPELSLV